MQYHCTSLAALPETDVALVGLRGERCIDDVENNPHVTQYLLSAPFAKAPRALWALTAPIKVMYQVCALFYTLLCLVRKPRAFLVQNPPAIPTLAVVMCVARFRGARVIVDWHNFGYSILALSLGARHPLVRLSEVYERILSRCADANLCVTGAMRLWLSAHWHVRATVLYDRPSAAFAPTPLPVRHALWTRLTPALPNVDHILSLRPVNSPSRPYNTVAGRTMQTVVGSDGVVNLFPNRPAILVSSTSWTADEDFNMFIDALQKLDDIASAPGPRGQALPNFLALITGKGPLRVAFEARVSTISWRRIMIRTLWLEHGDYPLLLGSADAGVSLHASSSGLDLPMKVVDMYGAGLPVLALDFAALPELVRHNHNGLVFRDAQQLAGQLESLFTGFPDNALATALRRGVAETAGLRWAENWNVQAAPLFTTGAKEKR